jgi:hypothetical protein
MPHRRLLIQNDVVWCCPRSTAEILPGQRIDLETLVPTTCYKTAQIKVDQMKNKNVDFYVENPNGKKPRNARRSITIIGGVLQYMRGLHFEKTHKRTYPLCAINVVSLSNLFYDYLGLYIGENNSLSWRTQNRVSLCYV